tara:strand:+ start:8098 stop:8217 length:120 start_codon:yes stop_codon:yes gene_type:complete
MGLQSNFSFGLAIAEAVVSLAATVPEGISIVRFAEIARL